MSALKASTSNATEMDSSEDPDTSTLAIDLPGRPSLRCNTCTAQLALVDELVSKNFSGRSGPAYLVRSVFNTKQGASETRPLLTGLHVTADIMCIGCDTLVGWKYIKAFHSTQRYKEDKYILELGRIHKDNKWNDDW